MKAILLIVALLSFACVNAQTAKLDKNGNYVAVSGGTKPKTPPIATGKTYTDSKGKIYPVYKTTTGKVFVLKVSKKTGKEYRSYLKIEP